MIRAPRFIVPAIARTAGFLLVAVTIILASLRLHDGKQSVGAEPSRSLFTAANKNPGNGAATSPARNQLAAELAHCQSIGMAAAHNTTCAAAWAENRNRFFSDRASPENAQQTSPKKPSFVSTVSGKQTPQTSEKK